MIEIGRTGVSIIAVFGLVPLSIGLGALLLVEKKQVKVHGLGLAATGPLLLLLTASLWGDARIALTALLLSAFLLLTSAVSGHALMWLLHSQGAWGSNRKTDDARAVPGRPPPE